MNLTFSGTVVSTPLVASGLEKACYSVQVAEACL